MGKLIAKGEELPRTITTTFAKAINPQGIILFGSWARGNQDPHSDIDLQITTESTFPGPQRYAQVRRLVWGMDLLVYTPDEFTRYQSVPGSFMHTVAHEGRVVDSRPVQGTY